MENDEILHMNKTCFGFGALATAALVQMILGHADLLNLAGSAGTTLVLVSAWLRWGAPRLARAA
ncbi:hypothetical protein [Acidovorax sp. sic0104]|uniref:hypothetical protein n=1 Tax=Acidovorax sp. sic0104 TaxID=2854784 RepID=UPI001C48F45A|nr:hypothetical protein [Acidovorax sp. sic0104]MBV7542040.1 hypothetical protein [Acidovorax sp. sic0104]